MVENVRRQNLEHEQMKCHGLLVSISTNVPPLPGVEGKEETGEGRACGILCGEGTRTLFPKLGEGPPPRRTALWMEVCSLWGLLGQCVVWPMVRRTISREGQKQFQDSKAQVEGRPNTEPKISLCIDWSQPNKSKLRSSSSTHLSYCKGCCMESTERDA